MRLIDADALYDRVEESRQDNPHKDPKVMANHINEHGHFLDMIIEAPTVDAEPVRHEQWEMIDEAMRLVENMRVCCGDVPLDDDMECAEFCASPCDMRNGELRFCRQWLLKDAADMIEFLVAKLDEVVTNSVKLEIELEQTKREKDAAVEDLREFASCLHCAYLMYDCAHRACSADSHEGWKWRGVKKEEQK